MDKTLRQYRAAESIIRRATKLAWTVQAEELAAFLVAGGHDSGTIDVAFIGTYFSDVWHYMDKLKPPQPKRCAECGDDGADMDRANMRYCSPKCRQKAYRKRVMDKTLRVQQKRNATPKRDALLAA